jgi:hypothetical protein
VKAGYLASAYDQHDIFSTAIVTGAGLDTDSLVLRMTPAAILSGRVPEGDKDFFLKIVDAEITFETDSQGKATDLILHQNGMNQKAKRSTNKRGVLGHSSQLVSAEQTATAGIFNRNEYAIYRKAIFPRSGG